VGWVKEHALLCMQVRVELATGWERVVLDVGRAWVEKFFVRILSVEPKHINSISSKITKHVDVLKLFASIALTTVGLLLHYDITTHCCKTLAQVLAMWWASGHFPILPLYLVRNNSV